MSISIPTDYKYLLKHYDIAYLDERFLFWYRCCKTVISNLELQSVARIDTYKLNLMVLSYFADIVRLKEFHPNIHRTRRVVIFAYSFFWLLRCSPIQVTDDVPKNIKRNGSIFINEMVVITLWISEFVEPLKIDTDLQGRYVQEINYFLRYRNYNAQSFELALTSLVLGSGDDPFYEILTA